MTRTLLATTLALALALVTAAAAADEARADVVTDRVLLVTGSAYGCTGTGALGFRRVLQQPDGSQTMESTEFQVPSNQYLEVTSVEYTTPYYTPWAKSYVQSLDLTLRRRAGGASTLVFMGRYQNASTYADDGAELEDLGERVSPAAQTRVAAFPVGPLMGSTARLCASATSSFWTFGGTVRVRGRLVPTGTTGFDGSNRLP